MQLSLHSGEGKAHDAGSSEGDVKDAAVGEEGPDVPFFKAEGPTGRAEFHIDYHREHLMGAERRKEKKGLKRGPGSPPGVYIRWLTPLGALGVILNGVF